MYINLENVYNGFSSVSLDVLSILIVIYSILTIKSKNPIISILYLITLFSLVASYLILIGLTFIGLAYILVYIGAVSILFLFILMMLNIRISEFLSINKNYLPLVIFSSFILIFRLSKKLLPSSLELYSLNYLSNTIFYGKTINYTSSVSWETNLIDVTHISAIGNIMYSSYSIWLIIISLILLLSMIGSIVITIKT